MAGPIRQSVVIGVGAAPATGTAVIMRVLFNCTTNVKGGCIQNAANFIRHARDDDRVEWSFAMSSPVADVLAAWGEPPRASEVFEHPAGSGATRRALRRTAAEDADLVYTMAGPAYMNFRCTHVLGISVPHITHGGWEGFTVGRGPIETVRAIGFTAGKGVLARCEGDFWVFQTETSREGFRRRFRVAAERTFVVPNAVGREFAHFAEAASVRRPGTGETIRVFCPAADYPHKNLRIIPEVAQRLRSGRDAPFEFVVTLPSDGKIWRSIEKRADRYGVDDLICNIGPFSYTDAPGLYGEADVVFIPSVLEVFSTSYLEAMAVGRPLVVADRPFAREICGSAAVYFDPASASAGAEAIRRSLRVDEDESARRTILSRYGEYARRFERIVAVLEAVHTWRR